MSKISDRVWIAIVVCTFVTLVLAVDYGVGIFGTLEVYDGVTLSDGTGQDFLIEIKTDAANPYLKYLTATDGLQLYTGAESDFDVRVGLTDRLQVNSGGADVTGILYVDGSFNAAGGGVYSTEVIFQHATETGRAWSSRDTDPASALFTHYINGNMEWEGATVADGFQGLLTTTDFTADRTWVKPDADGTWVLAHAATYNASTAFGDSSNYTRFAADGELSLTGTARVTKGLWVPFNAMKAPGTKPAEFLEHGISGAWTFSDATDDTIVANIKLPNDMDRSVVPVLGIGWSSTTADPGDNSKQAVWQVEYLYTALNEDTSAAAQETLELTASASTTVEGLVMSSFTGIDLAGASDVCIHLRIKRLGNDGDDDVGDDIELHGMCLTYTVNKLGTAT